MEEDDDDEEIDEGNGENSLDEAADPDEELRRHYLAMRMNTAESKRLMYQSQIQQLQ